MSSRLFLKKYCLILDLSSNESKALIDTEKSMLKSNIEAVEQKTESNIKVITEGLEDAVTRFNKYVSKTSEDVQNSQKQSEARFTRPNHFYFPIYISHDNILSYYYIPVAIFYPAHGF